MILTLLLSSETVLKVDAIIVRAQCRIIRSLGTYYRSFFVFVVFPLSRKSPQLVAERGYLHRNRQKKDEFMMASSKFRATIDCSGSVAVTEVENGIKKDKIRARANFTRTQNILLSLIDDN